MSLLTCANCGKPIEICKVRSLYANKTVYVHTEDNLATCFFENFRVVPNTFAKPKK